jgi:hypothetical protein
MCARLCTRLLHVLALPTPRTSCVTESEVLDKPGRRVVAPAVRTSVLVISTLQILSRWLCGCGLVCWCVFDLWTGVLEGVFGWPTNSGKNYHLVRWDRVCHLGRGRPGVYFVCRHRVVVVLTDIARLCTRLLHELAPHVLSPMNKGLRRRLLAELQGSGERKCEASKFGGLGA